MFVLIDDETEEEIALPAIRRTFRDEPVEVSFAPPLHQGSTGRVTVRVLPGKMMMEYFPSVVGARIEEAA